MSALAHYNLTMDDRLPQLEAVTDGAFMQSVFQEELFQASARPDRFFVVDCQTFHIRYRPGRNCQIGYRLTINDRHTNQMREVYLSARVYSARESLPRYHKARSRSLLTNSLGLSLLHLPALEMIVWAFPNDRKLTHLAELNDPGFLRASILPEVIRQNFGTDWQLADLSQELIRYVPEQSCTVRVCLSLCHARTGKVQSLALFGKTGYDDAGAATFARMEQLWQSELRSQGRLQIAQPLAWHAATNTMWQLGINGTMLSQQRVSQPEFLPLLQEAATTLAALQREQVTGLPIVGQTELLSRLRETGQMLETIRPGVNQRLHSLVARLCASCESTQTRPVTTLHGDLHLKNFLATAQGVSLIDLDCLCAGDPLQDVGSFLAGLYARGMVAYRPRCITDRLAETFISAWRRHVPWLVSEAALKWHIAAALVYERIWRSVRRYKTGRLETLDGLLELAEEFSRR